MIKCNNCEEEIIRSDNNRYYHKVSNKVWKVNYYGCTSPEPEVFKDE